MSKPYPRLVRHPGNAALFDAIEGSVVATLMGRPLHLHAEGLRGTGKTTILRAARQVLPPIRRIRGCLYNCDPDRPQCPDHNGLDAEAVRALGDEWVPMPFLELAHSSKLGTAVGSIDLARLADPTRPQAALLPGTIPQAHRGIIFVDEINRLADTSPDLADVLLDAMGTKPGRVQIEETGLPTVELEVSVSVWAASNPDEDPGPLEDVRKQLADRFDLVVSMGRPDTAEVVRTIMAQGLDSLAAACGLDAGPVAERVRAAPTDPASGHRDRLRKLARPAALPEIPGELRDLVAGAYVEFSLESLRGVEALCQAATLFALLAGRDRVTRGDLKKAAGLALGHRTDIATLAKILDRLDDPPAARADQRAAASGERAAGGAGHARGETAQATAGSAGAGADQGGAGTPGKAPQAPERVPAGASSPALAATGDAPRPSFWTRLVQRVRAAGDEGADGAPGLYPWPMGPGWSGIPEGLLPGYLHGGGRAPGPHPGYPPKGGPGPAGTPAGAGRGAGRGQREGARAADPTTLPVAAPAARARHLWEIAEDQVLGADEPGPRPWAR